MRAALQPVLLERLDAIARVHPAAALGRRRPQAATCAIAAISTEPRPAMHVGFTGRAQASAPLVQRERAGNCDVQRLRTGFERNRRAFVTLGDHGIGEPVPLRAERRSFPRPDPAVERLSAVRDERDTPPGSLVELSSRDAEHRAGRCPERLRPRWICATYGQRDERGLESIRRAISVPMLPGSATFQRASPAGGAVRASSRGRSLRRNTPIARGG